MKKFFTAVPLQAITDDLGTLTYRAVGNTRLQMEDPVSFPILTVVNGYAQPEEDFRLIAVSPDTDAARRNLQRLTDQLMALCARRRLSCPGGVELVTTGGDERVSTHVETFQKLLDYVDNDDELFFCMTFGTKPLSQAMMLALQYAYRVKRNASISCIVYGEIDRTGPKPWRTGNVYDMTALTQLDEIVHLLADRGVADPRAALASILSL